MKNNIKKNNIVLPIGELVPIIIETTENGGEFALVTAGTSMKPLLRDRMDTVYLKKPEFPLGCYEIPLYRRDNGQYVLHRICACHDGAYDMIGDNQLDVEHGVTEDRIIAVVSRINRKNRIIRTDSSVLYKIYVFLWCRCMFVRFFVKKTCALLYRIFK